MNQNMYTTCCLFLVSAPSINVPPYSDTFSYEFDLTDTHRTSARATISSTILCHRRYEENIDIERAPAFEPVLVAILCDVCALRLLSVIDCISSVNARDDDSE